MTVEVAGQIDIFEMIAEVAAEERARREQLDGVPTLFASPTRGPAARAAEYRAWKAKRGYFDSYRISHALTPGLDSAHGPTETCQPTHLEASLHCRCAVPLRDRTCQCVGGNLYRGACTGCDWEGENRADSDTAVCDALDHAHPGWLDDLSIAIPERRPTDMPAQWKDAVRAAIGERPDGWPVITRHTDTAGTRSIPVSSPSGGYDIAAAVASAHHARTTAPASTPTT